ncbi:hypothetical protein [Methylomagnum ishizawai]|nr:hypothetical protein [Methylomagnum ishizawai]
MITKDYRAIEDIGGLLRRKFTLTPPLLELVLQLVIAVVAVNDALSINSE